MGEDQPERRRDISSLALRGSVFRVGASAVTIILGFARSILLARFLLPEHFGVVALALFFTGLSAQLRAFGLDQALVHRRDGGETLRRTYLTLQLGLLALSTGIVLAIVIPIGRLYPTTPLLVWVLLSLVGVQWIKTMSSVQETLLSKELAFGQLALTDVVGSVTMTLVAPSLAMWGWGVWALVAEQASGILARFLMTWVVFRPWRPKLGWEPSLVRWLFAYGWSVWVSSNLSFLLERFDDFWVGTTLGQVPLGYYSRAYEFAGYPRRVIANPVTSVLMPVFARLEVDRLQLSRAFYRAGYVIVRTGFLVSGAFALVMPEFIHRVIGQQWQPMLLTFRLMLIYALLDALFRFGASLLFAVGRPAGVRDCNILQTVFFIPAVVMGAYAGGIEGVALVVDGMLVLGIYLMVRQVRQVVDFSVTRLGFWPLVALVVAGSAGIGLEATWGGSDLLLRAGAKLIVFTAVYGGLLAMVEGTEYMEGVRWLWANMWEGAEPPTRWTR